MSGDRSFGADALAGFLEIEGVVKRFGTLAAVDGVSLSIARGEFYSLLGPSGCGKTTLLRMIAGFERPDAGRIRLDGEDITDLPPNKRRVNTVFQHYALFPHLTVRDNIAFGPRLAGRPGGEIAREVERLLTLIRMEAHAGKRPEQLSGGQKQRVAVARALINRPQVLLLDEPLAALDLKLRQHMLTELDAIHDEVGITFLYVTHDQEEAMSLSDRIAVMNRGRVEQVGAPADIYETPRSRFVAAFIGDANFFEGTLAHGERNACVLDVAGLGPVRCLNDKELPLGRRACLSVRPEKIRVSRERPDPALWHNAFPGRVRDVIYLGFQTRYHVVVGDRLLSACRLHSRFRQEERPIRWEEDVWVAWHADDGYMMDGEGPSALPAAEGEAR